MARLSQQQLEEIARKRKGLEGEDVSDTASDNSELENSFLDEKARIDVSPKMVHDILSGNESPPYKYKLPKGYSIANNRKDIPSVNIDDYPKLHVKGKFSVDRQNKGANLYLLKEIDYLLDGINEGKNKNATLNFLIWVGLQTLKGMSGKIDIRVHDSTYADGKIITSHMNIDDDL